MSLFEHFYAILQVPIQVEIQFLIHHFLLEQKQLYCKKPVTITADLSVPLIIY